MAINLVAVGNQAPGFYGLNLQESATILDPQWASEANNAVITSDGRIGARKGFTTINTAAGDDITAGTVRMLHGYIDSSGNEDLFAAADNKIFRADSPYTDFTNVYSTSITADNWQAANFNGHVYFFQKDHAPLVFDITSGVIETLAAHTTHGAHSDSSDAVIATLKPNAVFAGFGRLWIGDASANQTKIWWSDSLAGQTWGAGTAGAIDLNTVLTGGTDQVVAINSFQDLLVIFLRNSILLYAGAQSDPANNLQLVEHIRGIGCIARDSVQNIGTDIIFLSDTGVRSLMRVVTEDNAPIRDISKNVRDYLKLFSYGETSEYIKSVYNPEEGFYLLSFPTFNKVFCFDLRGSLPDGAARVTTWDSITPTAMCSLLNHDLYMAQANNVGFYTGYGDDSVSYDFTYATPWLDYGQPYNLKVLKDFYVLAEAGANAQVSIQWAVDYKDVYATATKTTEGAEIAEYNESEYYCDATCIALGGHDGDSEYGYGYEVSTLQGPMSKTGKVVKMKVTVPILGKFDMKKYEIYAKIGRIN